MSYFCGESEAGACSDSCRVSSPVVSNGAVEPLPIAGKEAALLVNPEVECEPIEGWVKQGCAGNVCVVVVDRRV